MEGVARAERREVPGARAIKVKGHAIFSIFKSKIYYESIKQVKNVLIYGEQFFFGGGGFFLGAF